MTTEEKRIQHEHIYETRLAILEAAPIPTANEHNMAVAEADKDGLDLLTQPAAGAPEGLQRASDVAKRLSAIKDSL
jgi:hypothetical protein